MSCSAILDQMLEADLHVLEGEGESELAHHVRSCERCRSTARRILEQEQAMAAELETLAPTTPVARALENAKVIADATRRRRAAWRTVLPLAAAAGLVGIVLVQSGPRDIVDTVPVNRASAPVGVDVVAPVGHNVAVFKVVDRPDIVVVWFFKSGDE